MSEEQRSRRPAKKPAWMNEEMLLDPAEVEGEARVPRPYAQRRPQPVPDMRLVAVHHEAMMQRFRPDLPRRMCTFQNCKSPFDSPQWRRGPLGPGTLCNACGTRFARLQNKINGEKKGKLRPQERVEWDAFMEMLSDPQVPPQQSWQARMQQLVQLQQQQPYYDQQGLAAGPEGSDYYDDRSYDSHSLRAEQQHQQQRYADDYDGGMMEAVEQGAEADGPLMYRQGLADSPGAHSRAAAAAAAAAASAFAAAGPRAGNQAAGWRMRGHFAAAGGAGAAAEAATDSQEDEAAAYMHHQQEQHLGEAAAMAAAAAAAASGAGSPTDSFLHLLAVGEAMIKTEGVAPQDRRAAWAEVVERQLQPEPDRAPARQTETAAQGVKRSRFALEAEELQTLRPAHAAEPSAPTALQRALERVVQQSQPQQRHKPAADGAATAASAGGPAAAAAATAPTPAAAAAAGPASSEQVMPTDRFERLLAEAEQCIRARSVSPCMLRGAAAAAGMSPSISMPAPRPVTPLLLGISALDAGANGRSPMPRSLLGEQAQRRQNQQHQQLMGSLALPGAALDETSAAAAAAAAAGNSRGDAGGSSAMRDLLHRAGLSRMAPQDYAAAAAAAGGGGIARLASGASAVAADPSGGSPCSVQQHQARPGGSATSRSRLDKVQALMMGHMPESSGEPSPGSRDVLADEVLSPTSAAIHMMLSNRPRKQARTGTGPSQHQQDQGQEEGEGEGQGDEVCHGSQHGGHGGQHNDQQLADDDAMGDAVAAAGAGPAAQLGDAGANQQQSLMLQALLQGQQGGQQGGQLPGFGAGLGGNSQGGPVGAHTPVVLACQLLLQQQQGNSGALQPLLDATFGAAGGPHEQQQQQRGSKASTLRTIDQLKAASETAAAAAAHASAVAAATALLANQLQQQQLAQERLLQQERAEHAAVHGHEQQQPADAHQHSQEQQQGPLEGEGDEAVLPVDGGPTSEQQVGAGGDAVSASQAASGHGSGTISRTNSSSTSAAGISAAAGAAPASAPDAAAAAVADGAAAGVVGDVTAQGYISQYVAGAPSHGCDAVLRILAGSGPPEGPGGGDGVADGLVVGAAAAFDAGPDADAFEKEAGVAGDAADAELGAPFDGTAHAGVPIPVVAAKAAM